jgi:predicted aspartyl protease
MSGSRCRSIIIDVEILAPVPTQEYPQNQRLPRKVKALIDTGASRSAVNVSFVKTAKLVSYEKCTIRMAKGEYISSVYNVDILFPHGMPARNIKAAEFSGRHEFDFIVGMDILRMMDMAVTNAEGVTVLSLRSPPADKHIDFTKN